MIRIYNGGGSSYITAEILKKRFKKAGFSTTHINEQQIKKNGIPSETQLLVFSALSVTGFKNALKAEGMNAIKSYVYSGGHYLGICAGGYFGVEEIHFKGQDHKTGNIYSKHAEGLGLIKCLALGSLTEITKAPFTGQTDSAAIIQLQTMEGKSFQSPYWGGGRFIVEADSEILGINSKENFRVLSILKDHTPSPYAMGIQSNVGNFGGKATLLGYHPEIGVNDLEKWISPHENICSHTQRLFTHAAAGTADNNIDMAFDILLEQMGLKKPKDIQFTKQANKTLHVALQ